MKSLSRLLCFFGALFACAGPSHALTIPASEDSSSSVSRLTTAGNNSGVLLVDATHKAYVYFDLSEVPTTAVVRWAKLRVFLPAVRVKGSGVKVHTVTGEWNEASQSAEPAIAATPVANIGPDKLATKRFVTVDVTSTVQDWINLKTPNEGFAFVSIPNATPALVSAINFASKEGIMGGLPAELDIEFKPDTEEPLKLGQSLASLVNIGTYAVEELGTLRRSITPLLNDPLIQSGTFGLNDVSQLPPALRTFLTPSITEQPSLTTTAGSLSVQARGLGNLSYQWTRDGVPIVGGTDTQLLFRDGLQSGTYAVVVGNGFTNVTSAAVQITAPTFTDLFALVAGGSLPASSALGALPVDTFYIGRTEVRWSEWLAVREWAVGHGYDDLADVGQGLGYNYPATHVNWYDAVKWCNARSEKEGKTPVYKNGSAVYRTGQVAYPQVISAANGYRLPAEKEWEFAARGGVQTNGYKYSGSNNLDAVGWYDGNSSNTVHEVGKKLPNELGIYDMAGNLWEWCFDERAIGQTKASPGGYFFDKNISCEFSYRGHDYTNSRGVDNGFRVALSAGP